MKKRFGLILGFAVLGCLVIGCGKQSEEKVVNDIARAQVIAISTPAPISTLDTTQTMDKNTFTMVQHLFEGLYRFDEDSTPIPGLAEEVEISADGRTYTFTLREDIQWSNGEPITAQDFLYAWQKLVNPATQGPNAYLLDNVKNSQAIRQGERPITDIGLSAPDEKTFKVELEQAQPSFLSVIAIGWLAPQQQAYVESLGAEYAQSSEQLLYSGPFILTDWQLASDTWTLKKNPNYYDADQVKLEEIAVSTIKDENTGISLYQTNELDLTKISGQYVAQNTNDAGYVSHTEIANYFMDFNKKEGTPLANLALRQAISQAIDKNALAEQVLNDGSKALNGLIPQNLAQTENGEDFRKFSGDQLTYNVEAAQKQFARAQKELGETIKLSLLVTDDDNGKRVATFVQSQLQENLPGLEIVINAQPKNNLLQTRQDKEYELSISAWIAASSDLNSYFNLYVSDAGYNYGGFNNAAYDKLVTAARTTDANDWSQQLADYKQAEAILLKEEAAQVPLYQSAANYLINPELKGVSYHLYGDYFNLRTAYLETEE